LKGLLITNIVSDCGSEAIANGHSPVGCVDCDDRVRLRILLINVPEQGLTVELNNSWEDINALQQLAQGSSTTTEGART
jgi:hypothetical protein